MTEPVTDWLIPDWPAPVGIKACVTTRSGGVSVAPFDSFNLGDHVDDDPAAVALPDSGDLVAAIFLVDFAQEGLVCHAGGGKRQNLLHGCKVEHRPLAGPQAKGKLA